jgi:hypothetical protein
MSLYFRGVAALKTKKSNLISNLDNTPKEVRNTGNCLSKVDNFTGTVDKLKEMVDIVSGQSINRRKRLISKKMRTWLLFL